MNLMLLKLFNKNIIILLIHNKNKNHFLLMIYFHVKNQKIKFCSMMKKVHLFFMIKKFLKMKKFKSFNRIKMMIINLSIK